MNVKLALDHEWDVSPSEAIKIQKELAPRVQARTLDQTVETVAGVDVSVRDDFVQAAIAVIRLEDKKVIDQAIYKGAIPFPYIPGLLSFREVPAILPALEGLSVWPDVFMTDSHGLAHPRRFGLACHLGVILDQPVLGVAKSRLTGTYEAPDSTKGSYTWLHEKEDIVGAVVRTRTNINPVFVSIGHRITLEEAVQLTFDSTTRYKIPAPTRQAHLLSLKSLDR